VPESSQTEGFRTERVRLSSSALPRGAAPVRMAHLSDLHLRAPEPRHERLVEALERERPEFVFLTGDLISSRPGSLELLQGLLGRLTATHGVFACRGNWEVEHGPAVQALKAAMAEAGAELLVNESRRVAVGDVAVRVCALDDLCRGWPDFEAALDGADGRGYGVMLSHAPLAAEFVRPGLGVDLMLSGHTHGGQIRVPLLWRLALPGCRGRFCAGLYATDWGHVYVSRGFGTVGPVRARFRCPAELTIIEVWPA